MMSYVLVMMRFIFLRGSLISGTGRIFMKSTHKPSHLLPSRYLLSLHWALIHNTQNLVLLHHAPLKPNIVGDYKNNPRFVLIL